MKSNLEKRSSGYTINRAGNDAAGLAISEKMRAQLQKELNPPRASLPLCLTILAYSSTLLQFMKIFS